VVFPGLNKKEIAMSDPTATLVLGIRLDGETFMEYFNTVMNLDEGDEDNWIDWEELFAEKTGIKPPSGKDDTKWAAYCAQKRESMNGCQIGYFGHEDNYPYEVDWFVSCKEKMANYYTAEELSEEDLKSSLADLDRLKGFCELMGLEYKDPKWFLCVSE
jgi:hypothetical protein